MAGHGKRRETGVTANRRAFMVLVRDAMFRRVELAAIRRYADLADHDLAWSPSRWEEAMAPYAQHDSIATSQGLGRRFYWR